MTIHLHLGAHKTASTHIQAVLRKNAARLAGEGVRVVAPSEVRGLIGRGQRAAAEMAPIPSLRAALAARRLRRFLEGDERIAVSDENALGLTGEIIAAGALYPHAAARLRLWRSAAGARPLAVYFAVRDYAPFFAGAHAQSIRGGAMIPLEPAQIARLAALPRRWPDVIADIRRALPAARMTLWRFEDYAALQAEILRRMTGAGDLEPRRKRPMATPSAPAMEALFAAAATRPGRRIPKDEFERAGAATAGPRYMPFGEADQTRLATAYEEDVARFRTDPGIEFLVP
ncbi:MAG: hypothetical protein AAFP78_07010 [Pseudomonadota bacterium]